jgi:5-(carboxyamino)imidazole ribonucleotide synthase
VPDSPIARYPERPLAVRPPDARAEIVAARVNDLIRAHRPDLEVVHLGSTAVPELSGKGVVDLGINPPAAADLAEIRALLAELGFQRTTGPAAFPDTRPLFVGGLEEGGDVLPIHLHVIPDAGEWRRQIVFRERLRADAELRAGYMALKEEIVGSGETSGLQYSFRKATFIRGVLEDAGEAEPPIVPPATIGILGGGQLGRMLAMAARAMGYRIAVLDPDPACPAAAVADAVVVAPYDDIEAALRLAQMSDVVTYELEHVSADAVHAVANIRWIQPDPFALAMTQDRLAERRFLSSIGVPTAEWREVRSLEDLHAGVAALGAPLRLKASLGGYDGRSQVRVADPGTAAVEEAWRALGARAAEIGLLLEREVAFEQEVSVVIGRDLAGRSAPYPVVRNRHDTGILVESIAPAPGPRAVVPAAFALAEKIATALAAVGVITIEMFQMPDGTLLVNELAPRVHNSGHWTIEGARTSQFTQHVRAICGLPLGSVEMVSGGAAMVNLLGAGRDRPAAVLGVERALLDPGTAVHLYDKRRVFERRKMGHVTVVADSTGEALRRARTAAAEISWASAEPAGDVA